MQKIIDQMNWRKAVKSFDTSKPLNEEQVEALIQTARLAPTSYGLQPIKLYVVSNTEEKNKLFEAGYEQTQFSTASHVFVLAIREELEQKDINEQITRSAQQQRVSEESLSRYRNALKKNILGMSKESAFNWSARQAYILLGMMMSTAAQLQFDVSPMEGFSKDKFDEILGCKEEGYKSLVCLAAGYRDTQHAYIDRPKVRKTKEEFVKTI